MKKQKKEKLATLCLMFAMFWLPLGYDAAFALAMKLTGSYWKADFAFYCLSVFFFILYFYFSGKNPLKEVADIILSVYNDKIKHYFSKK